MLLETTIPHISKTELAYMGSILFCSFILPVMFAIVVVWKKQKGHEASSWLVLISLSLITAYLLNDLYFLHRIDDLHSYYLTPKMQAEFDYASVFQHEWMVRKVKRFFDFCIAVGVGIAALTCIVPDKKAMSKVE